MPVGDEPKTVFDSFEFLVTATEWVEVDLQSGTLKRRVQAPIGAWGASISPDRTRLALTGWDGDVALVDLDTGEPVKQPVRAHADRANSAAWSADGSQFAVTAADGTVSLWDGHTAQLLGSIAIPERTIGAAAFLGDSDTVIITPYTDSFYEWDTRLARTDRVRVHHGRPRHHPRRMARLVRRPALPTQLPPGLVLASLPHA